MIFLVHFCAQSFHHGLNEKNIAGDGRDLNFSINTSSSNTRYSFGIVEPYFANKKIEGYAIINWRTTVQINKSLILSFGINNLADYTNKDFGPFVGRSAYLEFSNKIKRG